MQCPWQCAWCTGLKAVHTVPYSRVTLERRTAKTDSKKRERATNDTERQPVCHSMPSHLADTIQRTRTRGLSPQWDWSRQQNPAKYIDEPSRATQFSCFARWMNYMPTNTAKEVVICLLTKGFSINTSGQYFLPPSTPVMINGTKINFKHFVRNSTWKPQSRKTRQISTQHWKDL